VDAVVGELATARADLAHGIAGVARLAAAGTHPFARTRGRLNSAERYERAARHYGAGVLERQLVFALQIHVAVGSSDVALAVHNALRSYLPHIAALAANAPFHGGEDTGLASVRPKICELLPRQGVPPALASWDELAAALRWGRESDIVPDPGSWWWELRPHPRFGTLELRVPDTQTTVAEAGVVIALVACLVAWLAARARADDLPPPDPTWRIVENRWLAARDGVEARFADLQTGQRRPVRDRLGELASELRDTAVELGCAGQLDELPELAERNGALRQRGIAGERGLAGLVSWLADRFLEGCDRGGRGQQGGLARLEAREQVAGPAGLDRE
jgi:glutamate---cysteine ligase / carboxylate-amine ligase